ncbi:hypothetical protein ACHAQD_002547 [Fusarium lateritium]
MAALGLPGPPGPDESSPEVEAGWVIDPTVEDVRKALIRNYPGDHVAVEHFSEGAYNKLFETTINHHTTYVLRVSLPVDPSNKTLSEVATLRYVGTISEIPIPIPITYDNSCCSAIGLEWIMMTKLDGETLHKVWPGLLPFQKEIVVRQIASFQLSLFHHRFDGIGNLYEGADLQPQRIVSIPFFQGGRSWIVNDRGPFQSSTRWIYARLNLQKKDAERIMAKYIRQNGNGPLTRKEYDCASEALHLASRLRPLVASFFFEHKNTLDVTVLHHDDLHANNILANEFGTVTGIVDWECVSCLPLWKACFYPKFLYAPPRHTPDEDPHQDPNSLAVQDSILRAVFLEEMAQSPEWMHIYTESMCKRDLSFAVDKVGSEDKQPHIRSWLNNLAKGMLTPSLLDMVFNL